MNQLFYNIAGGVVHKIRRKKRTAISEKTVHGRREILSKINKADRNWFYFNFSLESSSFIFNNFKRKNLGLPLKDETEQFVICLVLPECLSVKIAFYPRIVTALKTSFLFHCFPLFLPHLRTLAHEKRSENCLRFATSGPSLCLYPLLKRNIIFFPALTRAVRAKKNLAKLFAHAISEHYRDFEHAHVYWIWLRGSASYVIINN